VSEWDQAALDAEAERLAATEARGVCPFSGYTIQRCWEVELCDCAWSPPQRCSVCATVVWDLDAHITRIHIST
jgi:hypothetical protein